MPGSHPDAPEPLAGFLVFRTDEAGEWAALLVLDPLGVLHEFVYAGPVRPTPAQALLYGPTLEGQLRLQGLALPMLKALRAAPCCLLALLPLPPGLPLPLGRYESGQLHWQSPATPAAGQFTADFDRALGLAEPFDRATAALDYVIRHASATGSAGAGSAGPDDG